MEEPPVEENPPAEAISGLRHTLARGLELRQAVAAHYLLGRAPITFVQHFLGHENLATTGIYTQLVDGMAKKIALETETALEGMEDEDEGLMKERGSGYETEKDKWDSFVRWAVREQEADEVREETRGGRDTETR